MHHYKESGLDFVFLANGYEIRKTPYGEGVSFTAADSLDRAIARCIILATNRLSGQAVKFLRSQMELTQKELADQLGTKRITVARWEAKRATPIPGASDRLVRLIYGMRRKEADMLGPVLESLDEFGEDPINHLVMGVAPPTEESPANDQHDDDEAEWHRQKAAQ